MNRENCAYNLHQIGIAIFAYAGSHEDQFPDSFETLIQEANLSPIVFVCPMTDDTPASGTGTGATAANLTQGGHLSYRYVGRGLTLKNAVTHTVIAYEPLSNHGDGMNILFCDGHIEFVGRAEGRAIEANASAEALPITIPAGQ